MRMAADEYFETQVLTASRERLHLMVIDGALRFARHAVEALEAADFGMAHNALSRSRECVNELIVSLKPEPDAALADRLKGLFLFVHRRFVDADLGHDPQAVRDGIQILEMHRDTWIELIDRLHQERIANRTHDEPQDQSKSWLS